MPYKAAHLLGKAEESRSFPPLDLRQRVFQQDYPQESWIDDVRDSGGCAISFDIVLIRLKFPLIEGCVKDRIGDCGSGKSGRAGRELG